MSIIKQVTLQKIVAHDFRYDPRTSLDDVWYFVFIDTPTYHLQDFFFGKTEYPFLHQLKTLCNFFSSWKERAFGRSNFWLFTTRVPFTCLNNAASGTLYSFAALYIVIRPLFAISMAVFNLLKPTGYVMHQQFNIQQLYALPTLYLCVLYLSENKQRLVPLTA